MRENACVLLLVENNAYPFDVRVRREAHVLRDAGLPVAVVAPRGAGQRWTETVDGVRVWRFPAPPGGAGVLGYAFEFGYATLAMLLLSLWVALRHGVRVVHAANPPDTLFVVAAVLKLFGARFVFDHHDLAPETYQSRFATPRPDHVYRVLRGLERATFALADVVVATNESYRAIAIDRGRKRPERVFVVRNGPPRSFAPVALDESLRQRAAHLIGYIGTMGPQDGVEHLLRAVAHLVHALQRQDVLAVLIGDGDDAPRLRALARELGVEPWVWFTGRIPDADVRRLLSTVDVCVQPDPLSPLNDHSTMNKVMEYMALCKPTVAFDLTETRRSAADTALYATPNDDADLASRIAWLFDHPEQAQRLGQAARERFERWLAWEHSGPRLLQAYADGLGVRGRTAPVATPVTTAPLTSTAVPADAADPGARS